MSGAPRKRMGHTTMMESASFRERLFITAGRSELATPMVTALSITKGAMRGHFHIGHNMPGYMPESEVHCVDNAVDAWGIWQEEITHGLTYIEDDSDFLEIDTERNTITESDVFHGDVSVDIDPYSYWVEHSDDNILECQAAHLLSGFEFPSDDILTRANIFGAGA